MTAAAGKRGAQWNTIMDPAVRARSAASEAAPARGFDHEDVACAQGRRVAAVHRGDGAVGALDPVAAEGAGGAAPEAEGGDPAVAAERADRHRLAEPETA